MQKGFTPHHFAINLSSRTETSANKFVLRQSGAGFTLVELLVVIGVIVSVSGIVLGNWKAGDEELLLQRSAHQLAQDIRGASEMAMSARDFQGAIPQGGYGIFFRQNNDTYYIIYADTNGNERYNAADGVVQTADLPPGIYIKNISKNNLSINFKPPNPTIRIDGSSEAAVTLALRSDPGKTRTIRVNLVGLIEVE